MTVGSARFPRRAWRSCFTLVEFLIALGIIAVLASLTFPAIESGMGVAQSSKCLSNLRQIQAANLLYAGDHNGQFVPLRNASGQPWYEIADYLSYLANTNVFPKRVLCPKAGPIFQYYAGGYGGNATALGLSNPSQMNVAHPAESMAFADALDWNVSIGGQNGYQGVDVYTASTIAYRHGGKANLAFWDGHAESLARAQIVNNTNLWYILK